MKKIILLALILVIAATFTAAAFQAHAAGTPHATTASGVSTQPAYADLLKVAPPSVAPLRVGWNT
jgi:hypothetical protein